MAKNVLFKTKLNIQNALITWLMTSFPFFGHEKISSRTLLSRKFSLPCDRSFTLYSPRPSLPTISLMFITHLNFNAGRQLVIFKCPTQLKLQICYLYLTHRRNLVTATKKNQFGNSHVTDDVITLDVTWEDILWQMLSSCGLTVFYV